MADKTFTLPKPGKHLGFRHLLSITCEDEFREESKH